MEQQRWSKHPLMLLSILIVKLYSMHPSIIFMALMVYVIVVDFTESLHSILPGMLTYSSHSFTSLGQ